MKAILVATIGTRDLIYLVSSRGKWYNIGDDRMRNGDIIGEQAEVISDLSLPTPISYRDLTHLLLQQIDKYRDRIKPVIIGKLLTEKAADIEKVYLIGTDQKQEVPEREKDTLYACELIKSWLIHNYPHISVEVIPLGNDDKNPTNFDQMFMWWRQTWLKIAPQSKQQIWVCLKGGIGQAAEAARVSGLSLYGDRTQFFEFHQNFQANQVGICSDYTGPFLGTNYLWDRTQQQASKLLDRYDYAEVLDLLTPYFKQNTSGWGAVPNLLKAGLAWNQGQFKIFIKLLDNSLNLQQKEQIESFWWQAYEEAYLAVIRLEQDNTTEAMFHSFRAVEGLLYQWADNTFKEVTVKPDKYATLNRSIIQKYQSLKKLFDRNGQEDEIKLELRVMQRLLEADSPNVKTSQDWVMFCQNAVKERNNLFHQISGLSEIDVFKAWGHDVNNKTEWKTRILNCLNLVTGNRFQSLTQASLFASIHHQVKKAITDYELKKS